jgi:formate hydrogenlyase subunit 5
VTRLTLTNTVSLDLFRESVDHEIVEGARLCGLIALTNEPSIVAVLEERDGYRCVVAELDDDTTAYPALSVQLPAAEWYEREIRDLTGLTAVGATSDAPLVFPGRTPGWQHSRHGGEPLAEVDTTPLPSAVHGEGAFTIPYGPVRSGVFETVEFVVETTGEEILRLHVRPHYKHRGIKRRFQDLDVGDAVLLAERFEGTCSVAHSLALCTALEEIAGVEPPNEAQLLRVVHAELERIAVHLDSIIRHTEGAGLAVAYARLSTHKEHVMRLRADLCGSRFGRGVVVPGGVAGASLLSASATGERLHAIERDLTSDLHALMSTPSFLDRLRRTGPLSRDTAMRYGAVGPVGRGSGLVQDVRVDHPYGAYRHLGFEPATSYRAGDALARQWVRIYEVEQSFHLVQQALDELTSHATTSWSTPITPSPGVALAAVEAPQGELLYLVTVSDSGAVTVMPRTASFHNMCLFAEAFAGDIYTDFVFIEASFGLSFAGVAG